MKDKPTYEELEKQITELEKQNEVLKLSENALLANEEKFSSIIEDVPLSYQSLAAEGCFLIVNEATRQIWKFNKNMIILANQ